MYTTSSFIFFINISLLSLPFFIIGSESPIKIPKEWEHLTVKEITKKYKKIAIEQRSNIIFFLSIIAFCINPIIAMDQPDILNKFLPFLHEKYHDIAKEIMYNYESREKFKEKNREAIFLEIKKHEKLHQILVPMWQAETLFIIPDKANIKNTIVTKKLSGCVATGLHVLFSDGSQLAGITHYSLDPNDNEQQEKIKHLCLHALSLQNKNNTPIIHVDFFTTALRNEPSNHINNLSQSVYQRCLSALLKNFEKTVKNIFKETTHIAINHVPYDCATSDLLVGKVNAKSFKIKIDKNDTHLLIKGNPKIRLFTKNYLEKLANADYSLACKLSHEYATNQKK